MVQSAEAVSKNAEWKRIAAGIIGTAIFSFGMNYFIVPINLYSGGILGVGQLIRTMLVNGFGMQFGSFDIAGILQYLLNIPLVILAYKIMPKIFVVKLAIILTTMTLFLSIIPIPQAPLVDEMLTNSVIGGIICGFGMGTYLRAGCSSGGLEIIGIYFNRKNAAFSIGRVVMMINAVIYLICLFFFDISVVIYSIIFSAICSLVMDKVHFQNINVEAIIISKANNGRIEKSILEEIKRGVTCWDASGGYTGDKTEIMFIILSKYEVPALRKVVYDNNPEAFMVVKEGITVHGNYLRKL